MLIILLSNLIPIPQLMTNPNIIPDIPLSSSMIDMEITSNQNTNQNQDLDQSMKIIVTNDSFTPVVSKTTKKKRKRKLALLKKEADKAKKA